MDVKDHLLNMLKEIVTDEVRDRFIEAERLSNEESKTDPEIDPYKSLYKAREIWSQIEIEMKDKLNKSEPNSDENQIIQIILAAVGLQMGINFADTDETETGCKMLLAALGVFENDVKSKQFQRKSTGLRQCVLNQLGIVWAGRANYEEALKYLIKAQNIYFDFTTSNEDDSAEEPLHFDDLFRVQSNEENSIPKRKSFVDETYTNTLFYLAQVYGKLEQNEKSAKCCHETLKRQLETGKYEPLDWALNAATLSQYYMTQSDFTTARHCLASASCIDNEIKTVENLGPVTSADTQADIDMKEKVPRAKADIKRCWTKYALTLLETSRDRLMDELNETDTAAASDECLFPSIAPFNIEIARYEALVTDKCVSNYSEAREVFLYAQKCIEASKSFYIIDDFCSDYIEIVQDHSKIFKLLAFFEPDLERQCKMHKRRIDMIEDLLNQINKQHYLLVCRQLMYEIAESYSTILDLKLAILECSGKPPTTHAVKKINSLVNESLKNYQMYLDTLKTAEKKYPEKFPDNDLRPALVAWFCMGRLYSKIIDFQPVNRLKNLKSSLDHYDMLVRYCDRNPEAIERVPSELDVCSEMVLLLPAKMDKIRSEAGY
ncbi:KIF-binding protein-like [Tubulanus polymorphus]|uniref:KIF-binding protein-like n=1 Tax=Tubulanus polymorphus TaxID=672921 RepID=UPI003DA530CC